MLLTSSNTVTVITGSYNRDVYNGELTGSELQLRLGVSR